MFCLAFIKGIGQESVRVKIKKIGQEEGLLQLNAQAMTQDDMGYLWVGTEDGLHRFNSYEFKAYLANPKDSTTIKDDHIRGLATVDDTLWIATNSQGIIGYKRSKNVFFEVFKKEDSDFKIGHNIFKINDESLLFSVKNHFVIFDRKNKSYKIYKLPSSERENFVTDIFLLNNDELLLSTSVSGILSFKLQSEKLNDFSGKFEDKEVLAFLQKDETLFIASENGLFKLNLQDQKITATSITQKTVGIHQIDNDKLYVATADNVLEYIIEDNTFKNIIFVDKNNSTLEKVIVEQFISDDKGNLWLGTAGEGVFYINKFQTKFKTMQVTLPYENNGQRINIFPFYKKNENLWLGTGIGTVKYNPEKNIYKIYETGKGGLTYEFTEDANGTLWVGSIFDGLMKYDLKTDRFKQYRYTSDKNSLPDNEVLEIIPISKNKLWICTWSGGISEFDTEKETFTPVLINGKKLDRVRIHFFDSNGKLWLGGDEGLFRIDSPSAFGKTAKHYTENSEGKDQLTNNRIFDINEDNLGNLWLGTSSGLTKLNLKTDETSLYYKQKGFTNDFVYGILIDRENHIWMSTNYGLVVFDPEKADFKNYTKDDGLQDNEFNGKSSYKDNEGNFYFGGINGYNIFKPEEIVDNPYLPSVYIESVELFNKPIARNELFSDTLRFKSKENVLTFNFSALNYLNPQKSSYQYKLENFDEDWSPPTTKRSVTYTNLNPGTYQLKIRATNDAGIWNENARALTLIIIPSWYNTTHFRVALIFGIIISSFLFYRHKTSRLKNEKKKLAFLVEEKTRDLQNKNEALEVSNEKTLEQKKNIEFLMTELSHRVKNNLQIISSLLNIQANTVEDEKTKEIIKIAKNRILTISYIQTQLSTQTKNIDVSEFLREFTLRIVQVLSDEKNAKFEIEFNLQPNCICDINITLLGLIINELVTNTFKYAYKENVVGNVLKISCFKDIETIKICIDDNGKGYDTVTLKKDSLGLELIKEMVVQLKGTLRTETNNGTKNYFEIPCE